MSLAGNGDHNCPYCKDNFIVNNKFIQCKLCSLKVHISCVRLKDPVVKSLSESNNLRFYCDECILIVESKFAESSVPDPRTDDNCFSAEFVKQLISKTTEMVLRGMESKFSEIKTEIQILRESNIDLVRLLTSQGKYTSSDDALSYHPEITRKIAKSSKPKQLQLSQSTKIIKENTTIDSAAAKGPYLMKSSKKTNRSRSLTKDSQSSTEGVMKKKPKPITKGTGVSSELVRPAPKGRNWIWLGGLSANTSTDNIISYAATIWPNRDILCYDLKSKHSKKSFKFGSRDLDLQELLQAEHWPEGTLIRPFRNEKREFSS